MKIDYNHAANFHSLPGPLAAFAAIFADAKPKSLLDVGCGIGTWLRAAQECGVNDVFGVDGIALEPDQLLVSPTLFRQQDLTQTWNLGRRFDVALCLEVAEHLEERFAELLIESLVKHSDRVVFGAACAPQSGQGHVNCQWPAYWQHLFNKQGYVCSDEIRWRIWDNEQIEYWYRQNTFLARRNPMQAGKEPRIPSVIHSAAYPHFVQGEFSRHEERILQGALPFAWYLKCFPSVFFRKLWRKIVPTINPTPKSSFRRFPL